MLDATASDIDDELTDEDVEALEESERQIAAGEYRPAREVFDEVIRRLERKQKP